MSIRAYLFSCSSKKHQTSMSFSGIVKLTDLGNRNAYPSFFQQSDVPSSILLVHKIWKQRCLIISHSFPWVPSIASRGQTHYKITWTAAATLSGNFCDGGMRGRRRGMLIFCRGMHWPWTNGIVSWYRGLDHVPQFYFIPWLPSAG